MIIDASDFNALGDDLRSAAEHLHSGVGGVVSKGALNIKRQIQKDFRGDKSFEGVTDIRYNRKVSPNSVEADIGPYVDSEGFGSLVGIAIHGGSRGGGGTVPDPLLALRAEEPKFVEALLGLTGGVLND